MEPLSVDDLFSRYRSAHSQSLTAMDASQHVEEGIETPDALQNGSLPDSPGLGVSGANPRLVNGEAGAICEEDVRRQSSAGGNVLKVLTVSEAELMQSRDVEVEGLSVDGAELNGQTVQLKASQTPETDSEAKVCKVNYMKSSQACEECVCVVRVGGVCWKLVYATLLS